jgi:hypothetical protein
MRSEPPAAARGLVDRAAHEWVPESEPPRHVRLADDIELQKLVDGPHRRVLRDTRGDRDQLWLKRIARHGRAFEYQTRRLG